MSALQVHIRRRPTQARTGKVGSYPGLVKSGAGYFYDEVLEYLVWLHPERGARPVKGHSDCFVAFAQYEHALAFSQISPGAEVPLVLVRQLQYVNEPRPGVYQVVSKERLTEWQVQWLRGAGEALAGGYRPFHGKAQAMSAIATVRRFANT